MNKHFIDQFRMLNPSLTFGVWQPNKGFIRLLPFCKKVEAPLALLSMHFQNVELVMSRV